MPLLVIYLVVHNYYDENHKLQKVIDTTIYSDKWFRYPNQTKEQIENTQHIIEKGNIQDFIVEYNDDTKVVSPILVDTTKSILNFTAGKRITGISFLEGTLGWVQDGVEPIAIVIADFRSGSTDFVTHTVYDHLLYLSTIFLSTSTMNG